MRLFSAVDLDLEIKNYLNSLKFGNEYAKINWVPKKNLHITLKFFGDVSENKISHLDSLLKVVKFDKFKLKLNSLGFFPNEDSPNVIWIGVEPHDKFIELQKKIDEATLIFSEKAVKLGAHLTLGRIKSIKNKQQFIKLIKSMRIKPIEFNVTDFCLFKSKLTKDSPRYKLIKSYSLE